ncbi:uncharacterized protein LOC141595683 [Silene latifolia]|uniref:uncharacterized protein LOC141595683 n=1 Tax=Silene latifolia TaxID=37657 RepID=UPI003D77CB9B
MYTVDLLPSISSFYSKLTYLSLIALLLPFHLPPHSPSYSTASPSTTLFSFRRTPIEASSSSILNPCFNGLPAAIRFSNQDLGTRGTKLLAPIDLYVFVSRAVCVGALMRSWCLGSARLQTRGGFDPNLRAYRPGVLAVVQTLLVPQGGNALGAEIPQSALKSYCWDGESCPKVQPVGY